MSNQAQIIQRVTMLVAEVRRAVDDLEPNFVPPFARPILHGLEQLTEAVELLARLATEPLSDQEALTLVPGAPIERGICCDRMRVELSSTCKQHSSRFECPDALLIESAGSGFGIVIHNGGSSFVQIHFCPWCGTSLQAATEPSAIEQSTAQAKSEAPRPEFDWDRSFVGSI
jgi:hypothetical protein